MDFLITFIEGIISFISPCMLPMLPIYVTYFAGGADKKRLVLFRAICFVLGFTAVYAAMGLGAGAIVGIVIGSVAVVGVGGFAIFWFVIKKKTWADLLAVFQKK